MVDSRVFLLVLLAGILSVGVAFAPTVFKFGIEATLRSINALLAAILFVLVIIVATNLPAWTSPQSLSWTGPANLKLRFDANASTSKSTASSRKLETVERAHTANDNKASGDPLARILTRIPARSTATSTSTAAATATAPTVKVEPVSTIASAPTVASKAPAAKAADKKTGNDATNPIGSITPITSTASAPTVAPKAPAVKAAGKKIDKAGNASASDPTPISERNPASSSSSSSAPASASASASASTVQPKRAAVTVEEKPRASTSGTNTNTNTKQQQLGKSVKVKTSSSLASSSNASPTAATSDRPSSQASNQKADKEKEKEKEKEKGKGKEKAGEVMKKSTISAQQQQQKQQGEAEPSAPRMTKEKGKEREKVMGGEQQQEQQQQQQQQQGQDGSSVPGDAKGKGKEREKVVGDEHQQQQQQQQQQHQPQQQQQHQGEVEAGSSGTSGSSSIDTHIVGQETTLDNMVPMMTPMHGMTEITELWDNQGNSSGYMPAQGSFNGQTIPYYDPFFDLANAETLSAQAASYDPALSQLDFGMIDYPADLSVAPAPDAIAVDSGINVNAALDEHNEDGLTLPSDIHAMTNVPAGHFLTADPPSIGAPAGGESSFGPIRQRQDSNAAGSVGSQKPYRPYLAQERKKVSREPPEFVPFEKRPVSRHNAPLTPSRLRQSKTRGPSSSVSPAELAKVKSGNIVVTIPTVSPATRPATNSTLAQLSSPAASSEIDPEEGPSSSPSSSPPAARPLSPKRKYGEVEEVKKGKMTGPAESARKMRKVTDIPFEDGLLLSVPAMFIPDYDGAPTTTEPPTHKDEPLAAARQQTPPDSPTTGALMSDLFGDGDKDIAGDVQLDNAAPKLAATSSTSAGPSGSWTASDQALLDSADPSPMPNDQELERAAATALLGLGDYALSMPASSVRGMDDEEVDYDDSPDEDVWLEPLDDLAPSRASSSKRSRDAEDDDEDSRKRARSEAGSDADAEGEEMGELEAADDGPAAAEGSGTAEEQEVKPEPSPEDVEA